MTRFTHTLAAIGLTLAIAPTVLAGNDKHKKPAPQPTPAPTFKKPTTFPYVPQQSANKNYHVLHGTPFNYGYFYKGIHHKHWSSVYYNPLYRCYVYACPYTMAEYYWCPPANCFYPMTYVPYGTYQFGPATLPPAAGAPAPADVAPKAKATIDKDADTDDEDN